MRKLTLVLLASSLITNILLCAAFFLKPATRQMTLEQFLAQTQAAEQRGYQKAIAQSTAEAEEWAASWRAAQAQLEMQANQPRQTYQEIQLRQTQQQFYEEATRALRDPRRREQQAEIRARWGSVR